MCFNNVSVYIQQGFDVKEILIDCGRTDPRGNLALCNKCENQRSKILTNSDELEDSAWGDY